MLLSVIKPHLDKFGYWQSDRTICLCLPFWKLLATWAPRVGDRPQIVMLPYPLFSRKNLRDTDFEAVDEIFDRGGKRE